MLDAIANLADQVRSAAQAHAPLRIRAGGTKDFYGNEPRGSLLDPRCLSGIVAYEPSELVITALAGTPLRHIEDILAEQGQMLAFEPPHYGASATLGGCVASGIAGPRRASVGPAYGGVRDFVLGAQLIDSRGQLLRFGGSVMKNVAGYDMARTLAGSLGTLGVITQLSVKVLPRPTQECTLRFELSDAEALSRIHAWIARALPISASAWLENVFFVRLSGATAAVRSAQTSLGGTVLDEPAANAFWQSIREHTHDFFSGTTPLWRLSLPSTTPVIEISQPQLIEWGGAQRWVNTDLHGEAIRTMAHQQGGHATLFRGGDRTSVFAPLTPALLAIHRRLKASFDPAGIFNPGRMYPDL